LKVDAALGSNGPMPRISARSTSALRLFAAAVLALGCGGNIGGLKDALGHRDAAMEAPPILDGGVNAPGKNCAVSGLAQRPALGSCETQARACLSDPKALLDACGTPGFGPSLNQELGDCGVMCATLHVAVARGCVTDVAAPPDGQDAGVYQLAAKCAASHLIGTRWACAPTDGWYEIVVGLCQASIPP
jgi:hypothetical protein